MSLLTKALIEIHTLFFPYERAPKAPVARADHPTQLMHAARAGQTDKVSATLHEACVARHDRTALMLAAENGHLECCKLLVEAGEAGLVDERGVTALSRAVAAEQFSCALFLFPYEGHLSGVTPLMQAAALGGCDQLLLNTKYLNKKDLNGYTATMFASLYGNIKCLEYLSVNEQALGDLPLISTLQLAIKQSKLSSVSFLLYQKPDLLSNLFYSNDAWPNVDLSTCLTNILTMLGNTNAALHITPLMYKVALGQSISTTDLDTWATKRDFHKRTALMYCSQTNTNPQHTIDLLIEREAGLRDCSGYMAFYYAFITRNMPLASLLYEKEMEKTFRDTNNAFALAVSLRNPDLIAFCLDINIKKGYKPEHYKINIRNPLSVQGTITHLIESIIQGNPDDHILFREEIGIVSTNLFPFPLTALQALILTANYEHIPFLLGELGMTYSHHRTSLMLAASMTDSPTLFSVFPYLVAEHGSKDNQGMTALMHAARRGNISYLRGLLHLEVGTRDLAGQTALMHAVFNNNLEAVKLLASYEQGIPNFNGYTSLMVASYNNYIEIVKILMHEETGFATSENYTALALAMQEGHVEVAKLLYLLDIEVKKTKINPLIWSAFCGDVEGTLRYRQEYVMKQSAVCSTALKYAASARSPETVALLLEEAGIADDTKNTALMSAARLGSLECVRLLKPYELGMKNDNGETALFYAITRGHSEIVVELLEEASIVGQSTLVGMIMRYVADFRPEPTIADLILNDFVPRLLNSQ
ncbi:Protein 21.1 [Giardia lamblia P15]|uniref:Protein 21.1 n=1 Tax=Giardia intestinalis (strain P15) TaxID=658858 RepID=E1F9P3_GIAIA|nr:Protein 21.1 [Giardia lamblia P15]